MVAAVEITRKMIDAGANEIIRGFDWPDREEVGLYKARDVAKAVFVAMLTIQDRGCEGCDRAIERDEPVGNVADIARGPSVVVREPEAALSVPGRYKSEPGYISTISQAERHAIDQAMRDAVSVEREFPDLAQHIVERMFPRLIWVVKEELQRGLVQAVKTGTGCGVVVSE